MQLTDTAAQYGRALDTHEDMILTSRSRPSRGRAPNGGKWHYSDERYLVGIDDGNIFTTRVPGTITTVQQAIEWLRPALSYQPGAIRQGDLWLVPMSDKEATNVQQVDTQATIADCYLDFTRHKLVGFISVGSPTWIRGTVKAPDHNPVELRDWHRFAFNSRVLARGGD